MQIKGFVRGLALRKRHKTIRKSPIQYCQQRNLLPTVLSLLGQRVVAQKFTE